MNSAETTTRTIRGFDEPEAFDAELAALLADPVDDERDDEAGDEAGAPPSHDADDIIDELESGRQGGGDGSDEGVDEGDGSGAGAGDPPPPAPAPAAAAAAPQAPTEVSELTRLLLERERREAEQREAEARRQREEASRPAPLFEAADLDLTAEEEETYRASMPVIEKLVRRQLQDYHTRVQPAQAATLEELRAQLGSMQPQVQSMSNAAIAATLRSAVPDLDQRVNNPAWREYLNQPAPLQGGRTYGQLLAEAVDNPDLARRNPQLAVEIIRGFQAAEAPAQPAPPPRSPGRANGGAPASVAAAARGASGKQDKLKYSTFVRASEMFQNGDKNMSAERYQALSDRFMEADAQGLVDYTR